MSAYGLSQQLKISTEEAKGQMDSYFARFGGVRDYLLAVVEQGRKDGYTSTVLGRRRYLPELDSSNRQLRESAELEVAPGERAAVEDLVRERMGGAYPLDVPLGVSVGYGPTWDAAAH